MSVFFRIPETTNGGCAGKQPVSVKKNPYWIYIAGSLPVTRKGFLAVLRVAAVMVFLFRWFLEEVCLCTQLLLANTQRLSQPEIPGCQNRGC